MGGASLAGATLLGPRDAGASSAGDSGGGGGSESKLLNINLTGEVPDLNSATTTDSISFTVLTNLMAGLYRLDQDQKPIPEIAEGVRPAATGSPTSSR
jgi:oligopeptide transport system substrate-binding protein